MTRLRRIAFDVGVGMAAVFAVIFARRTVTMRRIERGLPVPNTRRNRKVERARARAAARWARDNGEQARAVLTASEKASLQLSIWDNARRTSEAYLDSASVVGASLGARASSTRSDRRALQTKVHELHVDAAPHLRAAASAQAELERLQVQLASLVRRLRGEAPAEVVALAKDLAEAHDAARRPVPGHLDEVHARQRLDQLSLLRESLELTLARLLDRRD